MEIRAGRLRTILEIDGDEDPTLEDLRHDGHLEARCAYGSLVDGSQVLPARSDVYAYNGDKFVLSNREFPEEARKYITEAEAYLAKRAKGEKTDDFDNSVESAKRQDANAPRVWYNLGACYAVTGQAEKAERCYHKAEQFLPLCDSPSFLLTRAIITTG